jgi:hypothetical protein
LRPTAFDNPTAILRRLVGCAASQRQCLQALAGHLCQYLQVKRIDLRAGYEGRIFSRTSKHEVQNRSSSKKLYTIFKEKSTEKRKAIRAKI